ncbi:putative sensor domain DACNV-containing protein [Chondromyces crocatus]|nr:diadenylate cyclase [Chondromyces crocatus]
MALTYPLDLAEAFFQEEERRARSDQQAGDTRETGALSRGPSPSRSILSRLVETMFFASMASEEGKVHPSSIVFAEDLDAFESARPVWDMTRLAVPLPFDVAHVPRLASACHWPHAFLAVVPQRDRLMIAGIATAHSRRLLEVDPLVRISAPKPGVLVVRRGEWEVARYERGTVRSAMSRHRVQIETIERRLAVQHAPPFLHPINDILMRIVSEMLDLRHGGLIAILGPGEDIDVDSENRQVDAEPMRLVPKLALGAWIRDMIALYVSSRSKNAGASPVEARAEGARASTSALSRASEAAARVDRALDQIARLTTVDGAVIMSHGLEVLAFGAKLRASKQVSDVYLARPDGRCDERWPLNARGTRHHAAVSFVAEHPDRIAFIVSQDGDAATFQGEADGRVIYRPL